MKSELIEQVMNEEHKVLNWVRSAPRWARTQLRHGETRPPTRLVISGLTAACGQIIQAAPETLFFSFKCTFLKPLALLVPLCCWEPH